MPFYMEAEALNEGCSIVYKGSMTEAGEKPQSITEYSDNYTVNWMRVDCISKNESVRLIEMVLIHHGSYLIKLYTEQTK